MIQRALVLLLSSMLAPLAAEAAEYRVLAFGDSNTFGQGDNGVECFVTQAGGYPPRLRTRLLDQGFDVEVANFGRCGERTGQGVTRIEGALATGGDVIVIMEATNDISAGVGAESIVFNLKEMARKAEEAGIKPLMASVVPRGPGSGRDEGNAKTGYIAYHMGEDSAAQGRPFADPFNALFSIGNFFNIYYNDPYHPNSSGYWIVADAIVPAAVEALESESLCGQVPAGPCQESGTVLCLNEGRFRLEAFWENFTGGTGLGQAVPQTDDTGAFFWFDSQNIELTIKVLDGRALNNHFWVFYGALSNVKFSLLVTDTETGVCREYFNPLGTFASVGDTSAFLVP